MLQDDLPDDAVLLGMTFTQLDMFARVMAEKFDDAYRHATAASTAEGEVAPEVLARLHRILELEVEVVAALKLKRIEDENTGHA